MSPYVISNTVTSSKMSPSQPQIQMWVCNLPYHRGVYTGEPWWVCLKFQDGQLLWITWYVQSNQCLFNSREEEEVTKEERYPHLANSSMCQGAGQGHILVLPPEGTQPCTHPCFNPGQLGWFLIPQTHRTVFAVCTPLFEAVCYNRRNKYTHCFCSWEPACSLEHTHINTREYM